MSSIEKDSNDFMQFVYVGAIGLITIGIAAFCLLKSGNKNTENKHDENEEKEDKEEKEVKEENQQEIKKNKNKNKNKKIKIKK